MVTCNGEEVDPGCWVEGHWGQYGPDHLADQADGLGWEPETCLDDPRELRRIADLIGDWGYPRDHTDMRSEGVNIIVSFWELHIESTDAIENWLNDHTDEGYSWGWHDGEFYLWATETWEENSW